MKRRQTLALIKLIVPVSVVTLLLAACAGSGSPAPAGGGQPSPAAQSASATKAPAPAQTAAPAAETTPCPLLTKQEVETTLGTAVFGADVLIQEGMLISCSYRDPKSPASILVGLLVKTDAQAKLGYDTRKKGATNPKAVTGLGDDAFWEESADNLEVMAGKNAIILTIGKGATADRLKAAQDLATKAIARLAAPASASTPAKAAAASGQGSVPDGCALLTKEEVEAVIGKPVEPSKETGSGGIFGCSYQDPAHKPQYFVGLTGLAGTPEQAKGAYENIKKGAAQAKAIAGLGDDAFWNEELGARLTVLKGSYEVSLDITPDATSDRLKAAQTMMAKVISRLP